MNTNWTNNNLESLAQIVYETASRCRVFDIVRQPFGVLMRFATVTALSLLVSAPAFAGGIGLITGAGVRTQDTYWYNDADITQQYIEQDTITMMGGGIEITLGDRDERFIGYFRGYYWQDAPETDPLSLSSVVLGDGSAPWAGVSDLELEDWRSWREDPRQIGMFTVGMSLGVLGNPREIMATVNVDVGSGFLSSDKQEFLQAEIGPGVSWAATRSVFVTGSVMATTRYRKGFSNGVHGYAGVRYMFD
jgi:hypothetical protein